MADVRSGGSRRGRRRERGQLILVGGVVVAFALVALVLLLNTALFAQSIATRGLGPSPDNAAAHGTFADDTSERILRHEERIEYTTWTAASVNTTRNVGRVDTAVRVRQLQEHGALADITVSSLRQGAVLVQNETRNFTAGGTNLHRDDWLLAGATTGIRNFTMTVDASQTANRSDPGNFTVVIEESGGNHSWTADVYNRSGRVEVRTRSTTCTSTSGVATINWTAGKLAGCSFPFATDSTGATLDGPFDLRFRNGTNATGTYHVVVSDKGGGAVEDGNVFGPGSGESPRQYVAVYAVVLDVHYEGSTTTYETHVRAAPGEPEETSPAP